MHTEVFGAVSSGVLRMEMCEYVFVGAYNVVVSCLLLYVFIGAYSLMTRCR